MPIVRYLRWRCVVTVTQSGQRRRRAGPLPNCRQQRTQDPYFGGVIAGGNKLPDSSSQQTAK